MKHIKDINPPSIQKQTLTCFDSDQLGEVVKGASFELHQMDKGAFQADLFSASFGKGTLDIGQYNRSILTEGTFSSDSMIIGFLLDTKGESRLNGSSVKTHDMSLSDSGSPLEFHLSSDSLWSSFQFKREDLLKTGINWSDIFSYLKNSNHSQASSINTTMLYNNLLSIYAHAISNTDSSTPLKRNESTLLAKKIYHYLQDHASEPIQMIELTALIGKSERTVERLFKKYFGIPPYTYLKLHRLHLIRKRLMQRDPTFINISHLAMENGFMEIGYFGREYKKTFGETPSETLKNNRG
jgi:AraC family ethanolamine operon transcriptional activator